jgi:hypothetical protein
MDDFMKISTTFIKIVMKKCPLKTKNNGDRAHTIGKRKLVINGYSQDAQKVDFHINIHTPFFCLYSLLSTVFCPL